MPFGFDDYAIGKAFDLSLQITRRAGLTHG